MSAALQVSSLVGMSMPSMAYAEVLNISARLIFPSEHQTLRYPMEMTNSVVHLRGYTDSTEWRDRSIFADGEVTEQCANLGRDHSFSVIFVSCCRGSPSFSSTSQLFLCLSLERDNNKMRLTVTNLLPLLAFSAVAVADANTVINDFNSINGNLNKLDIDVNLVQSGLTGIGQALQVSVDSVTVDDGLLLVNSDILASSTYSAADSKSIVDAVSNVATTANKTLVDVANKYSAFGGLSPVVLASLYQLKQDQNTVGVSLYSKLDPSQVNRGIAILVGLNNAFNAVIKVYGGS